jgi:drug/metabolite transporter (DMT)-like permease
MRRRGHGKMKTANLVWLTVIVLLWGSAFPLVKIALAEVPPITLGFLRFLVATPILVVHAYVSDSSGFRAVFRNHASAIIVMGLTGVMGYHVLQNIGIQYTSVTNSSLLISSNPIILAVLSVLFLREKVKAIQAAGIVIGFSGVVAVILTEGQGLSLGTSSLVGDLLSLGGGASWAIYSIVGKRLSTRVSPTGLTAASTIVGTACLIPPTLLLEAPHVPATWGGWLAIVALSLGPTCLAYVLWNRVLSEEAASRVGVSLFLIPVVTTALSAAFLSEPLTLFMLAGMGLVLSGVVITESTRVPP